MIDAMSQRGVSICICNVRIYEGLGLQSLHGGEGSPKITIDRLRNEWLKSVEFLTWEK